MNRIQRILFLLLIVALALPSQAQVAQTPLQPAGAHAAVSANGVDTLAVSDEETLFQMAAGSYRLEDADGPDGPCRRIVIDGFEAAGEPGAPHLPVRTVLLGLPPGAQPVVQIANEQRSPVVAGVRLCAAPEAVAEEDENGLTRYVEQAVAQDQALYGQNTLFPASPVRIVEQGYMGRLRYVRLEIAPFQYNPAEGTLLHRPYMQVRVEHRGTGVLAAAGNAVDDTFVRSVTGVLLNGAQAAGWAEAQPAAAMQAASNNGWAPPANALRLYVEEEGLYELTYAEMVQAGVPVNTISSHNLRLYLNGQDVAVRVVDANNVDDVDGILMSGDRLLFYGQGVDEKYTGRNVYWLTWGGSGGYFMSTRNPATGGDSVNSYRATLRYEENFNYVSSAPKLPGYNHWYGRLLTVAGANAANSWRIPYTVSNPAATGNQARITATMVSRTRGNHHVKFYVNESYVGDGQWSNASYQTFTVDFDQSLLTSGTNMIRGEIVNDLPGQTVSVVYMDWMTLTFQRQMVAENDRLIFAVPTAGNWQIAVDGFTGGGLEAYDVTDPLRVVRVALADTNSALFGATTTGSRRYLVQRTSQRKRVAGIEKADTVDLLASSNRADYFIITHREFLGAIQPLAAYRAARNLRVAVIDVQHIYDTFNFGRMSPQAIRDFLIYAYNNWQTSGSSYVLLVGDGTFDPRQYRSDSARTFVPPFLEMVDPDLGETAADNRYVTIVGTDLMPDMHLGRLPAESPADVTAMVNKIIDYESAPADSGWNRNVLFVSDDLKGGGGAFYNYSNAIADGTMILDGQEVSLLPAQYQKTKLYLPYDCASGDNCRERIVENINQGALLVSYVGHGAKEYWAEENLLNLAALEQMNNDAYPVMLPMTCLEGYYQEAEKGRMSLAEALVRKPRSGAIASWSSSGLGLASGHDYLERGFFIGVFHIGVRELGPATWLGKTFLYANAPANKYDDLLDTFTLLGDPALRLRTLDSKAEPRNYNVFLPAVQR